MVLPIDRPDYTARMVRALREYRPLLLLSQNRVSMFNHRILIALLAGFFGGLPRMLRRCCPARSISLPSSNASV